MFKGQCAGCGNYNKADTLADNLRQTKTRIPLTHKAAIAMTKQIRVIMSVCPETISKNMDSVRSEFGAWASSVRAHRRWTTATP
jgi:hypothetical protein